MPPWMDDLEVVILFLYFAYKLAQFNIFYGGDTLVKKKAKNTIFGRYVNLVHGSNHVFRHVATAESALFPVKTVKNPRMVPYASTWNNLNATQYHNMRPSKAARSVMKGKILKEKGCDALCGIEDHYTGNRQYSPVP